MDLRKLDSVFNPLTDVQHPINIIGCGALGSNLAVMLTRLGIQNIILYDYDIVEPHNITNQAYYTKHIGRLKTEALTEILKEINPELNIETRGKYKRQVLEGYVFLCLDNIEIRKAIVEQNKYNQCITAMFDLRMGLYEAQCYTAKWNQKEIDFLLSTMDFTHEEAQQNVPTSPCGTTLSVISTVQSIASYAIINFIKLVRAQEVKPIAIIDLYNNAILAM